MISLLNLNRPLNFTIDYFDILEINVLNSINKNISLDEFCIIFVLNGFKFNEKVSTQTHRQTFGIIHYFFFIVLVI